MPIDWESACVVYLYKCKDDKYECITFRGINLLSIVGKVYGWVLIKKIRKVTKGVIWMSSTF